MKTLFPRAHRGAFTLVEILVVVVILGILAALLFPVFAGTRERGRRGVCQGHLRQMGLAITQYAQDFDENMPYSYLFYAPPEHDLRMWDDLIQPYLKSYGVLVCPSAPYTIAYQWQRTIQPYPLLLSYASNQVSDAPGSTVAPFPRGIGNPSTPPPTSLALFAQPATTILVGECGHDIYAEFDSYRRTDAGDDGSLPLSLAKRHSGGSNWLFADGHVKWLPRTTAPMWTLAAD